MTLIVAPVLAGLIFHRGQVSACVNAVLLFLVIEHPIWAVLKCHFNSSVSGVSREVYLGIFVIICYKIEEVLLRHLRRVVAVEVVAGVFAARISIGWQLQDLKKVLEP
jgi:hypothetical protein